MTAELVLSVLSGSDDHRGFVASLAVTDQQIVAVGGTSGAAPGGRAPMVIAALAGQRFEPRVVPRERGLRDVLAVGDSLWACGEHGTLAVSRDHGAHWQLVDTATDACLFGLALGSDGAIWVAGDAGYAARVLGEAARRIDLGTTARLASIHAVRDEIVALGGDGRVVRWRDGQATTVACGTSAPLTGLAVTAKGTWVVVGDGGFVARSPDGTWYSRVAPGIAADLEAIGALADGTLVIVGDRGQILCSADDARTWRTIGHDLGPVHLWSVERHADGVLIGGDDGLIARLARQAPPREVAPAPAAVDRGGAASDGWDAAAAAAEPAAAEAPVSPDAIAQASLTADVLAEPIVAEAPVSADTARAAELDRTPVAHWAELAWRWIDDGAAQRALVSRLAAAAPAQHAQIAELQRTGDAERARLAAELSPVLEAVIVGSLARGEPLEAVLGLPPAGARGASRDGGLDDDDDDDDDDDESPGWAAIDRALAPIYGKTEPLHYGTIVPFSLGGNDPIHGISVYARAEPQPHWHFVTYGFTELFRKDNEDPDESGYGFELTFRLGRDPGDTAPPTWALNFLQNLGRYVFSTGNAFAAGHKMGLNGPIALGQDTRITAICFADDPELGELTSAHGVARFVQIVGITDDEYKLIQEWSTTGLVEILKQHLPFLITDLGRRSVLDEPAIAEVIRERVEREGSSEDLTFAGEMTLDVVAGQIRIELGALYAAALPRAMRGRIIHGRGYELRGRNATLQLAPGATPGYRDDGHQLVLELTVPLAREIDAALRSELAGTYRFATWDRLTIVVTPSIIRGQDGSATDVRGIADPVAAVRVIAEENARLAAKAAGGDGKGASGDGKGAEGEGGEGDQAAGAAKRDATRTSRASEAVTHREHGARDDGTRDDDVRGADADNDAGANANDNANINDDAGDNDSDDANINDDAGDNDSDDNDVDNGASAADAADAAADVPDPARIAAALAMTRRALRLTPDDEDVQFTHAMLLLDAERGGDAAQGAALLAALPAFAPSVRINIAVRMASADHPQFAAAAELVLAESLPERVLGGGTSGAGAGAAVASFGDITHELFEELGEAILERSPRLIATLVPLLPDDAKLLSELAQRSIQAGEREAALALYDRMVALAIPDGGDDRTSYLRSFNNACIQAHAARAFDTAARLADRVQPVAHENPHLYHAAACAYAAIHDYAKAFEQVKLAIEHDYDHVAKIETDSDLGALLDWPELKSLFRDWHARQEGN